MNLAAQDGDAERLQYSLQHEPVLWDIQVTTEGPGNKYEDFTVKDSDVATWKTILVRMTFVRLGPVHIS